MAMNNMFCKNKSPNIIKQKFRILYILIIGLIISACSGSSKSNDIKVIVLGFDGMDAAMTKKLMNEGKLPNFSILSSIGGFSPLTTSMPPQSPVAWSDFITGKNAGGHDIFDFIHRDPETMFPYMSTTITDDISFTLPLGKYNIPLGGGSVKLLRKGKAFWEILEDNGIMSTIFKIPSNYPPVKSGTRSLSGMGTPDLHGGYGKYTFFTNAESWKSKKILGGSLVNVIVENNVIKTILTGPANLLKDGVPNETIPLNIYIDPENPVIEIEVSGQSIILKEGEWSDWVEVKFEILPYITTISGIVRFYLKSAAPEFSLYTSPINIDPGNPAQPISEPESYSAELKEKLGNFYTQGMAEETNALDEGVLTKDEFIHQADIVFQERLRMFDLELSRFNEGFLFFYFSTIDQNSHMFWNLYFPEHPTYDEETAGKYGKYIEDLYVKMDDVLRKTMEILDDNTILLVMSDHGFAPFFKEFSLNTWLKDEGYLGIIGDQDSDSTGFLQRVNWTNTTAYGLGLNALYINLKGREVAGIVNPIVKNSLLREIKNNLLALKDPDSGENIITKIYEREDIYSGPYLENAPDLIIGYNRGYRASNVSASGGFTKETLIPNMGHWSGDHCMDFEFVPGILLSNKNIIAADPALNDLASTFLKIFNISVPEDMINREIINIKK